MSYCRVWLEQLTRSLNWIYQKLVLCVFISCNQFHMACILNTYGSSQIHEKPTFDNTILLFWSVVQFLKNKLHEDFKSIIYNSYYYFCKDHVVCLLPYGLPAELTDLILFSLHFVSYIQFCVYWVWHENNVRGKTFLFHNKQ